MQVVVLNGVNLDVLARRDPALYGGLSLSVAPDEVQCTHNCSVCTHGSEIIENRATRYRVCP